MQLVQPERYLAENLAVAQLMLRAVPGKEERKQLKKKTVYGTICLKEPH
jgi:hypothetical protein